MSQTQGQEKQSIEISSLMFASGTIASLGLRRVAGPRGDTTSSYFFGCRFVSNIPIPIFYS
jgi:hypothetical protein